MKSMRNFIRCILIFSMALVLTIALMPNQLFRILDSPATGDASEEHSGGSDSTTPTMAIELRAVDGGAEYYSRFHNSLPGDDEYFPIAVWMESVVDDEGLNLDLDIGLNTYLALVPGSDVKKIQDAGMSALFSWDGQNRNGWVYPDEVDMWAGPGSSRWSGNGIGGGDICIPAASKCGYTVMSESKKVAPDNVLTYANFGKGVTFWELDDEAKRFVNGVQDVVSADNYWFTDPGICGFSEGGVIQGGGLELPETDCRMASNYGWTVSRLRSMIEPQGSKLVWALVEVGHPSDNPSAPTIKPEQIGAAVWSSIVHGARGIVYFNHSFAGPCVSQHVLRDCGSRLRDQVRAVNRQLRDLAPVLNAPFAINAISAGPGADIAVKAHDGELYVIGTSTKTEPNVVDFQARCEVGATVEVLGEDRSIPMEGQKWSDEFSTPNSVHIYRLDAPRCLP